MTLKREQAVQLWLPALAHFAATGPVRALLLRADQLPDGASGFLAGLREYFPDIDTSLPAGALTRQFVAHDAGDALWLAADPAWARPDINGIRLMACGHLQLDMAQAQALAAPLLPLFAEAGMQLQVSTPEHWHVRLPADTVLPEFSAPEQAMGEDLSQHMPQGPAGKRWRLLLNEVQVALHQNPLNAARHARRMVPVNTLWLWGGGRLPKPVRTELRGVISDDVLLSAVAQRAGLEPQSRTTANIGRASAGWLIDLQDVAAGDVEAQWWSILEPLATRQLLALNFASGERWLRRPWHRWRLWRRAPR
jgi:hypothetical protein